MAKYEMEEDLFNVNTIYGCSRPQLLNNFKILQTPIIRVMFATNNLMTHHNLEIFLNLRRILLYCQYIVVMIIIVTG